MMRTPVRVIPVDLADRRLASRFIRVPWHINRVHHPSAHWVPPLRYERRRYLDRRRNPFFDHVDAAFWLAKAAGQDVGRIAAVKDRDWQRFHQDSSGSFGMFDSPDDPDVAGALLDAATSWLRRQAVDSVLGPFDLSTNYATGMLVAGFDSDPYIDMPYNPPYYERLITGYGFRREKDLWQWGIDPLEPVPSRVARIAAIARSRYGVSVRTLRMRQWEREIDLLGEFYNDTWSANWGFVPLPERELRHIAKNLKHFIRPELAIAAEVDAVPVGFALCVPNINTVLRSLNGRLLPFGAFRLLRTRSRRTVESVRLMLLGIRREYRGRGVDAVLMQEMHRAVNAVGVRRVEIGWTSEDNLSINRAVEAMGGWRAKTYRVFRLDLSGEAG